MYSVTDETKDRRVLYIEKAAGVTYVGSTSQASLTTGIMFTPRKKAIVRRQTNRSAVRCCGRAMIMTSVQMITISDNKPIYMYNRPQHSTGSVV